MGHVVTGWLGPDGAGPNALACGPRGPGLMGQSFPGGGFRWEWLRDPGGVSLGSKRGVLRGARTRVQDRLHCRGREVMSQALGVDAELLGCGAFPVIGAQHRANIVEVAGRPVA